MTTYKVIGPHTINVPDTPYPERGYVTTHPVRDATHYAEADPNNGIISNAVVVPDITQVNWALERVYEHLQALSDAVRLLADAVEVETTNLYVQLNILRQDIEYKIGSLERKDPVPDERFEGLAE